MEIFAKVFPKIMESEDLLDFAHVLVRKGAHFTEYFILGGLSTMATHQYSVRWKPAISMLFCFVIACMDETLQLFVAGREGRIFDVMIDNCGAILGIVIVIIIIKKIRKSEKIIKKI